MFKLLAISGSPRRQGNSELLLDEFIKGAESKGEIYVQKIIIAEKNISPCTECLHCLEHTECCINDDMQAIYSSLREADGIIISSPVFFMGPPAQLKAMIDRCQMLWSLKYSFKKPINPDKKIRKGFFITLGALPEKIGPGNFHGNINSIKALFHVLEVEFKGYLTYFGIEKNKEILTKNNILQDAYKAGIEMVS